jgi:hypothetical protein
MAAGTYTLFGVELLNSPSFKQSMSQLNNQYDIILFASNALPASGEGEVLLSQFPYAAITLKHETIENLERITRLLERHPEHRVIFLKCCENHSI